MKLHSNDSQLPAATLQRLVQFSKRQRLLEGWRGLAIGVVGFAVCLTIAVFLDGWLDTRWARWLGSCLIYGLVLAISVRFWIVPRYRAIKLEETARQLERCVPQLRERLLSALELSSADTVATGDSDAFRERLQQEVASSIAAVNVHELLPWRLIRRSLTVACVALISLAMANLIPALRFSHRAVRVLLPTAEVGRVTSVAITIENPAPEVQLVPRGEVVAIRALVDGPPVESVWLELKHSSSEQQLPMTKTQPPARGTNTSSVASQRYEATFSADQPAVDYRVAAAGAYTPWRHLETRERPRVTRFRSLVTPPDYTASDVQLLDSDQGHIVALTGSQVEMRLSTNQPVADAQIVWEDGEWHAQTETTPLEWQPQDQALVGIFDVATSRSYRIRLRSEETSFTNEFSPQYRVTAVEDQPPRITWQSPQASSLVAAPDDVVALSVSVQDELPPVTLTRLGRLDSPLRVDPPEWRRVELASTGNGEFAWELDLKPWLLSAGDVLELKLEAQDSSGNVGQSGVRKILLSSTSVDSAFSATELARLEITHRLERLAEDVATLMPDSDAVVKSDSPNAMQRPASDEPLAELLGREIPPLVSDLKQACRQDTNALNTQELQWTAECLIDLLFDTRQQTETPEDIASRVTSLANQMRVLVSHDVIRRHSEQIAKLARAQQELASERELTTAQLRRRHTILISQIENVQQAMIDSLSSVRQQTGQSLQRSAENLGHLIDQIERKVQSSDSEFLADLGKSNAESLQRMRLFSRLDNTLAGTVVQAQQDLLQAAPAAHASLFEYANAANASPGADSSTELSRRAANLLGESRSVLRSAGPVSQAFSADLGSARRALLALADNGTVGAPDKSFPAQSIALAVRTLEAAHQIDVAAHLLQVLQAGERWKLNTLEARSEHPRIWGGFKVQLQRSQSSIRAAELPTAITAAMAELMESDLLEQVAVRLATRLSEPRPVVGVGESLDQLQTDMQEIQHLLYPFVKQARQQLAVLAPGISELADRAAQETKAVEQATKMLADAVRKRQIPDRGLRISQLQRSVNELSDPISELREALVDQADAQHLLDRTALELARKADAAIDLVDVAERQATQSLEGIPDTSDSIAAQALESSSAQQAQATRALEELATAFRPDGSSQLDENSLAESTGEQWIEHMQRLAEELDQSFNDAHKARQYAQAEELSELNSADPREVLSHLENELDRNNAMQEEISDIAKTAVTGALQSLETARRLQALIVPELEDSDPSIRSQKKLLVYDLLLTHEEMDEGLELLLSEAMSNAGAARSPAEESRIESVRIKLEQILKGEPITTQSSFRELQTEASRLADALAETSEELSVSARSLTAASEQPFHTNGADLSNRRRVLKDRQTRIQQQDLRHLLKSQRAYLQRLRQADRDLLKTSQALAEITAQSEALEQPTEEASNHGPQSHPTQQRRLELAQRDVEATQSLRDALQARARRAEETLKNSRDRKLASLTSLNPTAELAGFLAEVSSSRASYLCERLTDWSDREALPTEATGESLRKSLQRVDAVDASARLAAEQLARAGRHEARLDQQSTSEALLHVSDLIQLITEQELRETKQGLTDALSEAEDSTSNSGQASGPTTGRVLSSSGAAETALTHVIHELETLLEEPATMKNPQTAPTPSQPSTNSPFNQTLDSKEMAQLLDELDRRLLSELNLGPQEDNSEGRSVGKSDQQSSAESDASQTSPSTLSQAAQQLANSLSNKRETSPKSANADLGMATESALSQVEPQGPVAVQVTPVARTSTEDWGELRQQAAEGASGSRELMVSPSYREQVEAYFRSLSIRGQQSGTLAP